MEFTYDVTLSFAGEDREYVEAVAKTLKENGIKVFYDKFEEVDLWGKDLGIHFDYVYRKGARYCAIFISEHYKKKIWTNHEVKTAIARAIASNVEYILPARFDDTEIDGIRPTLGFIDLRTITPEKFAHLIIKKLEKEPTVPLPETQQKSESKVYLGVNALVHEFQGRVGCVMRVNMVNTVKEPRYFNEPTFRLSKPFPNGGHSFYLIEKLIPVAFPVKLEYGQPCEVNYNIVPKSVEMWKTLEPDTMIHAVVTTTLGERFNSNEVPITDIFKVFRIR